jgi:UDP-N-acetylglucosamine 3-dehydrogenase
MKTVRLAMIGLGAMGSNHARILPKIPGVEITGVCDLIEEKAKSFGKTLGVPWCTDYHDLLDQAEAVWICTEPFNRKDIVLTCAKENKQIFTEKPIANTIEDARVMVEAADKAGVIYMLGYCLRFWNPYRLIKKTFDSGELGSLVEC